MALENDTQAPDFDLANQYGEHVRLSDFRGVRPVALVFFPLADTGSVPLVFLSVAGMLFIQGAYLGPQPAVFSELFPTAVRYSGVSLSLTLATVFGGAIAPIVATYLFGLTGTSSLVTVYITAVSVVSWLCSLGLPETFRDSLVHREAAPWTQGRQAPPR